MQRRRHRYQGSRGYLSITGIKGLLQESGLTQRGRTFGSKSLGAYSGTWTKVHRSTLQKHWDSWTNPTLYENPRGLNPSRATGGLLVAYGERLLLCDNGLCGCTSKYPVEAVGRLLVAMTSLSFYLIKSNGHSLTPGFQISPKCLLG